MQLKLYAIAAAGGGIGTIARLFVSLKCRDWSEVLPYGVLLVNLVGSFLIGIVAGYLILKPSVSEHLRLFLIIGILGGFTTFSSFSYNTLNLIKLGNYGFALTNILIQVIGGIVLAAIGFYLSHTIIS